MKKFLLLTLAIMLCLSHCSCTSLLANVKSMITGEAVSKPPEDFVAEGKNDEYGYEIYDSYIRITKYTAEATEVKIPSEIDGRPVTVIGSLCFYQTTEITTVEIPSSVEKIESQAFYCATKLTKIVVPDSVQFIGERAFAWCSALESVELGEGIAEIPNYCFNSCTSLASVKINSGITQIGLRAFSYCDKLKEVEIPSSVEKVGERAFENCTSLEFAVFNNSSAEIGEKCFENSPNVAVIAQKNSAVMDYCESNGLRWSESKDVEATVIGGEASSDETSAESK